MMAEVSSEGGIAFRWLSLNLTDGGNQANKDSGNGLVPSAKKPLRMPMSTQFYVVIFNLFV